MEIWRGSGKTVDYESIANINTTTVLEQIESDADLKTEVLEFAKGKRGTESARQREVKHGGDGEGIKGRGARGDKHTARRSGRRSTKNRDPNKGWKDYSNKKR